MPRNYSPMRRSKFSGFDMKREIARGPVETPAPIAQEPKWINPDLPAIKPVHPTWFRVMRAEYPQGRKTEFRWVCIFETPSEDEAIQVAQRQTCKARVSDKSSKQVFDNLAPMKEVGIKRHLFDRDGVVCIAGVEVSEYDVPVGDLERVQADPAWRSELCAWCLRRMERMSL